MSSPVNFPVAALQLMDKNGCNISSCCFQEFGGALKVVKVETDGNPSLVEKFKVRFCALLKPQIIPRIRTLMTDPG